MKINVWKFGGSFFVAIIMLLLKNFFRKKLKKTKTLFVVSAIANVTRILRHIVQVSCIFEKSASAEIDNMEFKEEMIKMLLKEFRAKHLKLISGLFLGDDRKKAKEHFEKIFFELQKCIKSFKKGDNKNQFYASILKFGEIASSTIFSDFLNSIGIKSTLFDARDYLTTKSSSGYKNARLLRLDTSFVNLFTGADVLVTQGFIGKNSEGQDVVLGFDGSDYSAACFAGALARAGKQIFLTFFKDVTGFSEEDPAVNPLAKIHYRILLSWYRKLPTRPIRLDAIVYALKNGVKKVEMACFRNPDGRKASIHI